MILTKIQAFTPVLPSQKLDAQLYTQLQSICTVLKDVMGSSSATELQLLQFSWLIQKLPRTKRYDSNWSEVIPTQLFVLFEDISRQVSVGGYQGVATEFKKVASTLLHAFNKLRLLTKSKTGTFTAPLDAQYPISCNPLRKALQVKCDAFILSEVSRAIGCLDLPDPTADLETFRTWFDDTKNQKACLRCFELVGEAIKLVDPEKIDKFPILSLRLTEDGPLFWGQFRNHCHHDAKRLWELVQFEPQLFKPFILEALPALNRESKAYINRKPSLEAEALVVSLRENSEKLVSDIKVRVSSKVPDLFATIEGSFCSVPTPFLKYCYGLNPALTCTQNETDFMAKMWTDYVEPHLKPGAAEVLIKNTIVEMLRATEGNQTSHETCRAFADGFSHKSKAALIAEAEAILTKLETTLEKREGDAFSALRVQFQAIVDQLVIVETDSGVEKRDGKAYLTLMKIFEEYRCELKPFVIPWDHIVTAPYQSGEIPELHTLPPYGKDYAVVLELYDAILETVKAELLAAINSIEDSWRTYTENCDIQTLSTTEIPQVVGNFSELSTFFKTYESLFCGEIDGLITAVSAKPPSLSQNVVKGWVDLDGDYDIEDIPKGEGLPKKEAKKLQKAAEMRNKARISYSARETNYHQALAKCKAIRTALNGVTFDKARRWTALSDAVAALSTVELESDKEACKAVFKGFNIPTKAQADKLMKKYNVKLDLPDVFDLSKAVKLVIDSLSPKVSSKKEELIKALDRAKDESQCEYVEAMLLNGDPGAGMTRLYTGHALTQVLAPFVTSRASHLEVEGRAVFLDKWFNIKREVSGLLPLEPDLIHVIEGKPLSSGALVQLSKPVFERLMAFLNGAYKLGVTKGELTQLAELPKNKHDAHKKACIQTLLDQLSIYTDMRQLLPHIKAVCYGAILHTSDLDDGETQLRRLKQSVDKLVELFPEQSAASETDLLVLAYELERIGDMAPLLSRVYSSRSSREHSLSAGYFRVLDLTRKLLAHYPISLHPQELKWGLLHLSTELHRDLQDAELSDTSPVLVELETQTHAQMTPEIFSKGSVLLKDCLDSLDFEKEIRIVDTDFSGISREGGLPLGNFCILVQSKESERDIWSRVYDCQLRLSHIFKQDVKVIARDFGSGEILNPPTTMPSPLFETCIQSAKKVEEWILMYGSYQDFLSDNWIRVELDDDFTVTYMYRKLHGIYTVFFEELGINSSQLQAMPDDALAQEVWPVLLAHLSLDFQQYQNFILNLLPLPESTPLGYVSLSDNEGTPDALQYVIVENGTPFDGDELDLEALTIYAVRCMLDHRNFIRTILDPRMDIQKTDFQRARLTSLISTDTERADFETEKLQYEEEPEFMKERIARESKPIAKALAEEFNKIKGLYSPDIAIAYTRWLEADKDLEQALLTFYTENSIRLKGNYVRFTQDEKHYVDSKVVEAGYEWANYGMVVSWRQFINRCHYENNRLETEGDVSQGFKEMLNDDALLESVLKLFKRRTIVMKLLTTLVTAHEAKQGPVAPFEIERRDGAIHITTPKDPLDALDPIYFKLEKLCRPITSPAVFKEIRSYLGVRSKKGGALTKVAKVVAADLHAQCQVFSSEVTVVKGESDIQLTRFSTWTSNEWGAHVNQEDVRRFEAQAKYRPYLGFESDIRESYKEFTGAALIKETFTKPLEEVEDDLSALVRGLLPSRVYAEDGMGPMPYIRAIQKVEKPKLITQGFTSAHQLTLRNLLPVSTVPELLAKAKLKPERIQVLMAALSPEQIRNYEDYLLFFPLYQETVDCIYALQVLHKEYEVLKKDILSYQGQPQYPYFINRLERYEKDFEVLVAQRNTLMAQLRKTRHYVYNLYNQAIVLWTKTYGVASGKDTVRTKTKREPYWERADAQTMQYLFSSLEDRFVSGPLENLV